jgi:hypothetical protein
MAFENGNFYSASNLAEVIKDFASRHGWTRNGDVLNNANGFVRITSPSASATRIEGSTDASFAVNKICNHPAQVGITTWPPVGAYYAFAMSDPDMIWIVVEYNLSYHQYLCFGDIQKVANVPGGNFFGATHGPENTDGMFIMNTDASGTNGGGGGAWARHSGVFFWNTGNRYPWDGGEHPNRGSFLHYEMDGYVWPGDQGVNTPAPDCPTCLKPLHHYMNGADGQLDLMPYWLTLGRPNSLYSDVGEFPWLRVARLENFQPGDIMTVGADRWMIWPWYQRDALAPNGGVGTSGLWGYALKYDGP